ncbi:hypothetical protein PR202_ga30742 [Eleusine coracana subsp. coracana]|uniref:DUF4220 domain-containing protein n=1 Tax=Eleusine coracana subsp. coracana TaxID=191504 RepID=A0AAV5DNC2_ELECO|nr:hypothetical protein PR202_ga30742 [Eleusine coracana subsp. coracana]
MVLISFTLQVFLFFTGVLRPRSANSFLRFSTWIGYLGADWVAVYILGFLSRQVRAPTKDGQGTSDPLLTFIWAPFLLVHLGGQDTITAFATGTVTYG